MYTWGVMWREATEKWKAWKVFCCSPNASLGSEVDVRWLDFRCFLNMELSSELTFKCVWQRVYLTVQSQLSGYTAVRRTQLSHQHEELLEHFLECATFSLTNEMPQECRVYLIPVIQYYASTASASIGSRQGTCTQLLFFFCNFFFCLVFVLFL